MDTCVVLFVSKETSQGCTSRGHLALYPEALDDGMRALPAAPAGMFSNQPTAMEQMTEPSQMLRDAVCNLINYQVSNRSRVLLMLWASYKCIMSDPGSTFLECRSHTIAPL